MYKDVTNIIIDTLRKFKGVRYVRYTGDDLINQQNNHEYIQCWVDNISHHQFNITDNTAKVEYQIYILGFPTGESGSTELDIQDKCYDVALYTIAYIDYNKEYNGTVSVYDYDILTLSKFTDDSSAGVKLSLVLTIPNGVSMCELEDHFGEPYSGDTDTEITISGDTVSDDLVIKPIHLPKSNVC